MQTKNETDRLPGDLRRLSRLDLKRTIAEYFTNDCTEIRLFQHATNGEYISAVKEAIRQWPTPSTVITFGSEVLTESKVEATEKFMNKRAPKGAYDKLLKTKFSMSIGYETADEAEKSFAEDEAEKLENAVGAVNLVEWCPILKRWIDYLKNYSKGVTLQPGPHLSDNKEMKEANSFRLTNNSNANFDALESVCNILKQGGFIDQATTLPQFKRVFSGKSIENKISWIGNVNELNYFIKGLHNRQDRNTQN